MTNQYEDYDYAAMQEAEAILNGTIPSTPETYAMVQKWYGNADSLEQFAVAYNPTTPSTKYCQLFRNLTGQAFGYLKIFGIYSRNPKGEILWLCRCKCGNWTLGNTSELARNRKVSCGEHRRDRLSTHGEASKPVSVEYRAYTHSKNRCENPNNHRYPYYGGRGIEFRFQSFDEFLAELGRRPSNDFSIDRIDNDGHYERGNVRWATKSQQASNRRARK